MVIGFVKDITPPKPGCEIRYWLSHKHLDKALNLWRRTPWWQWRKKARRWDFSVEATDRMHIYGRDVVAEEWFS